MNPTSFALRLEDVGVLAPASTQARRLPGAGKAAPKYLLQEIGLSIAVGEQVAIIGRSGAGKTMLLSCLAASLQPQQGQVELLGQQVWKLSAKARQELRGQLFFAPQTPPLPPRQRVITTVLAGRLPNWSLWRSLLSLFKPQEPLAAWQALAEFGLQEKLYARVDQLSGGERQRCGLARMLLSSAQIFLVDEPLSALDPKLATNTLLKLQAQAQARNASLVCSLHQVELARQFFPRLIGVRGGKILFDAASSEVSQAMIDALYADDADDATHEDAGNALVDDASSTGDFSRTAIPCV